jgi:phytoene/squalene synthetase/type II secretory pathway pseudopilin PulG
MTEAILNKLENFRQNENFPVASFLLPKKIRKPLKAIYKFARYADEIADSDEISEEEKINELSKLTDAIENKNADNLPIFLRDIIFYINNFDFKKTHLLNLLSAFIQDVKKNRYQTINETLNYCQKSAATVGRMFLECSQEFSVDIDKSDKICTVLQLLNHLQDLKQDYQKLNRIYFDTTMITNEKDLELFSESENIKNAKTKILNILQNYLTDSSNITKDINSYLVRLEIKTIINIANLLIKKLLVNDIISQKIKLSNAEKFLCFTKAIIPSFSRQKKSKNGLLQMIKSKSSFLFPIILMNCKKRKAMTVFYNFCKLVDDSADNPNSTFKPFFWRKEIEKMQSDNPKLYPEHTISRQVAILADNLGVDKSYLSEIIAGQEMDYNNHMFLPDIKILNDYCYKVASCVGLFAVEIFGYNASNKQQIKIFAENLGRYFQYINILRDFEEDLRNGRVYLPKELIEKHKVETVYLIDRRNDVTNLKTKLKPIFLEIAQLAKDFRKTAFEALPENEITNMKPAIMMEKIYTKYLSIMENYEFNFERKNISLNLQEKLSLISFNNTSKKSGFSLVSLVIVMVIIGLMIVGILAGKELIENNRRDEVIKDYNKYRTSVNAFRLEYAYLPGDLPDAQNYFDLSRANCASFTSCYSNNIVNSVSGWYTKGNGLVEPLYGHETSFAWIQMGLAGILTDKYSTPSQAYQNSNVATCGVNMPSGPYDNTCYQITNTLHDYMTDTQNNWLVLGGQRSDATWISYLEAASIKPENAFLIDTKIDDSYPKSGSIIVITPQGDPDTATYLTANSVSATYNCGGTFAYPDKSQASYNYWQLQLDRKACYIAMKI